VSAYRFRPLTQELAAAIAAWRYEDGTSIPIRGDTATGWFAAFSETDELVGCCWFGADARLPGSADEPGTLDVAASLRPDLTGIGLGGPFLRAACAHGAELFGPNALRLAMPASSWRARHVAAALGFEQVGLASSDGGEYVILQRPA
jgi:[ribosomal protein S18]-alanine N-acetyltransferase